MNMKSIIATAAVALGTLSLSNAGIQTYQGSTRWGATLFTPGARTIASASSYTSYFILETNGNNVLNALRVDAWVTAYGRYYYVDYSLAADYAFFGTYYTEIAGGFESADVSAVIPFRGYPLYGRLNSFVFYPTVDYYANNGNLDISTITGSGRLNTYFSGNISLNSALDQVLNYLEARGYYEY
jgi:hypothetical protein